MKELLKEASGLAIRILLTVLPFVLLAALFHHLF
jgi:hypothetical protein